MFGVAQLINEGWAYESNTKDHEVALRLYKTAYNNLLDINSQVGSLTIGSIPPVSPFEVRSVADYISYRTCHIQFLLNHPREAITQFRKHIDTFKQHTKSPEYAFEHAAWLSQQYLLFADLFSQAVTQGVKTSKSQHPGHYYYEAAMQMIVRRKNITEYTNDFIRSNQMPVTRELLTVINPSSFASFLRQCGWTCVEVIDAPPVGPNAQALSPPELEPINYSDIIIRHLHKAAEFFEEWGRPRMCSYINVLTADEYLASNNPQRAQALYLAALPTYERDNWWTSVKDIKSKLASIELTLGVEATTINDS